MNTLDTVWTREAMGDCPLPDYPRPMLVRDSWISLNGMWNYIITNARIRPYQFYETDAFPFDGEIRVPFSPEAPLSGVNRRVLPDDTLWYARNIILPKDYFCKEDQKLLLHFGAVDQICIVYINGKQARYHKGGYLPFTVDISSYVKEDKVVRILVSVKDFSDTSYHSRGKQKLESGGMFYTAQSGIWQTVWMEAVPKQHIENLRLIPDYDKGSLRIRIKTLPRETPEECQERSAVCEIYSPVMLEADGVSGQYCENLLCSAALIPGKESSISIPQRRSWTPEKPWLYPVRITFGEDVVYSYFALRKCDIQHTKDGYPRLFLNNKPYYQAGILDQGYWPDGLYTAPSDDALIYDIRTMKSLGFNMLRKHVKVEPDRWYFHCDRLGMLVWQDMVNGGSSYLKWFTPYLATPLHLLNVRVHDFHRYLLSRRSFDGRQEFIDQVYQTVKTLYNHPSIVCWVPFNEGWGQFSTEKITDMIRRIDPNRLINSACGWFDQRCGDIKGFHNYFFWPKAPRDSRVLAVTEFGGYSWKIPGHHMSNTVFGYQTFTDQESLSGAYEDLIRTKILPRVKKGFSASVYTQLSDVEDEINGILTYDRKVTKLLPLVVQKWNSKLKSEMMKIE